MNKPKAYSSFIRKLPIKPKHKEYLTKTWIGGAVGALAGLVIALLNIGAHRLAGTFLYPTFIAANSCIAAGGAACATIWNPVYLTITKIIIVLLGFILGTLLDNILKK